VCEITKDSSTEGEFVDSLLKEMVDNLVVPVVVTKACYNDKGDIVDIKVIYVNSQYSKQTKQFLKVGDSYQTLQHILPDGIDWFERTVVTLKTGVPYESEYFTKRINTWFHMTVQRVGKDICVFTIINVTSEKVKDNHLEFLESNDTTTGLGNSKKFNDILQQSISYAESNKSLVGLILLNIDNLRSINDLSGRTTGDEIINTLANIMLRMETPNIHAFRLEGNEFALLVNNPKSESFMRTLSEDLFVKLSSHNVSVSMGIALYPIHGTTSFTLFRDADLALHYVKSNGKGTFAFFAPDMYNTFLSRVQIQKRIFTGIEQNQFKLFYQPQFYLGKHKLRGFEALIRWYDSINGWCAPLTFIPIAEESNVIQILGEWILETAISTLKHWQTDFAFDGIMSINVSPVQLKSPLFLPNIERIIKKYQVQPEKIELEITESVFIANVEQTAKLLKKISDQGIRISLDDFGTGYSSLRYLANMPINTLKLDKSFIDSINDKDTINTEIISSLIPVTKKAGMETIAEGVEHQEQLNALSSMNCNCVQGFLWGKPMPEDKCDLFLKGDASALDTLAENH
jgi:diguanylate cyclase (GGDEF)-like protein